MCDKVGFGENYRTLVLKLLILRFREYNYGFWCIFFLNYDRGPNTHVFRFLERHGIPYHYLCTTKENKREEEILDLVQDTDFLILARYMQVNKMISSVRNHINYLVNIEREECMVLYSFIIEVQNTKSANRIFSILL